jgi:outer membrane protein TolC
VHAPPGGGGDDAPSLEIAIKRQWSEASEPEANGEDRGPLTVIRAIEEALASSPELEQIERRLDSAGAQVRQAQAVFYPRVAFSEEYNFTDNPVFALMHIINQKRFDPTINFNDPGTEQNFSSRIQGEWQLFEGGSGWYDRQAALNRRRSTEADLLAARNRLVATVTQTYYRWLQAIDFIWVGEKALEAARADERLAEARVQAEIALPSELLRLKTRTAETHSNLVNARISARRLQAAMERLLARPLRRWEIPDPRVVNIEPEDIQPHEEPSELIAIALEQRPELTSVRALILAAQDRIRSAKGKFLPRMGVQSFYQWDSEDLSGGGDSWLVSVQATWALFEGGLSVAKVREAESRLREIQSQGEQIGLDIALQVKQASLGVQEAAEKIKVAAQRRRWAREGLEETRHLYRNQVVTVDSLLQAEVAWNRAEAAYTAALFDGKIAQTVLRQALGEFADTVTRKHHEP